MIKIVWLTVLINFVFCREGSEGSEGIEGIEGSEGSEVYGGCVLGEGIDD